MSDRAFPSASSKAVEAAAPTVINVEPTVEVDLSSRGWARLSSWRSISPTAAFWTFLVAHVASWTITPILCCPNAPLDLIEMVFWGREWQWGYPKHPPLVSWLAAAIVACTGANTWGLFLASQVAIGVAFWCAWRLGREITSPRTALLGVVILEGCLFFNVNGVALNNNVGLYPFWALSALCFYWAIG
jgi:4-amino-4-deoxy-L-arabinose transferase-like glycosyltransferase